MPGATPPHPALAVAALHCGQWVAGEETATPRGMGACARSRRDPRPAPRASSRSRSRLHPGLHRLRSGLETPRGSSCLDDPVILSRPGDGTSTLDVEDMAAACHEYAERYPPAASFAFDEYGPAASSSSSASSGRSPPRAHPPTPKQPTTPLRGSHELRRAHFDPQAPASRPARSSPSHVLAAAARFVGERWRFVKPRGRDRWIDGLIAAAIAIDIVRREMEPRTSVYESRFLAEAA